MNAHTPRLGAGIDAVVFDESHYWPKPPEPDEHTLTYPGKVDMPAGTRLGPGLDGRTVTVIGCIYDQGSNETHVFVEALTPPPVAETVEVLAFSKRVAEVFTRRVADRHELALAESAGLA